MNVSDLITILAGYPGDLIVCVQGEDGGVTEGINVRQEKVALNVHQLPYYGEHEAISLDDPLVESKEVLLVGRLVSAPGKKGA